MRHLFCLLLLFCQLTYGQDTSKIKTLIQLSLVFEQKGDFDNSIRVHKQIIDIDPKNYQSPNAIAGLYGQMGQFQEEILWAQRALKINPKFSMGFVNLGNGYAGQGDLKKAEEYYNEAEKYDSTSAYPPYSLGVLEETKGNTKSAIAYYELSVSRDSTFENGYFNLAASYANLKDFKRANENILKVLKLNPNAKDAQEMYKHIIKDLQTH